MARIRYDLPGGLWVRMISPTHLDYAGFTDAGGTKQRLWDRTALTALPEVLAAAGFGQERYAAAAPYLPLAGFAGPSIWPGGTKIVTLAGNYLTVMCGDLGDTWLVRVRRDPDRTLWVDRGDWIAATGARACLPDAGEQVCPERLANRAALPGAPELGPALWRLLGAYTMAGLGDLAPSFLPVGAPPLRRAGTAHLVLDRALSDGTLSARSHAEQCARLLD